MFDFQKLLVYQKAKALNKDIQKLLKERRSINSYLRDQLNRASVSAVINIAEGSGKFSKADRRNFYTIARGSTYECASLIEVIAEDGNLQESEFIDFCGRYEEVSKMLFGLIESQR